MNSEKRRESIGYVLAEFCIKNYFLFEKISHHFNSLNWVARFLADDAILNSV